MSAEAFAGRTRRRRLRAGQRVVHVARDHDLGPGPQAGDVDPGSRRSAARPRQVPARLVERAGRRGPEHARAAVAGAAAGPSTIRRRRGAGVADERRCRVEAVSGPARWAAGAAPDARQLDHRHRPVVGAASRHA